MKRSVCLLGVLFLFGVTAKAQETPKVDLFAGYSYVRANPATSGADSFNLHGGSASLAWNVNNWLGIVGDFGGYHTGEISGVSVDATTYTYLFGPRVSYRKYDRFTPFGQVLFGGAHESISTLGASTSENSFAMALGGGLDAKLTDRFSWRVGQVEYLLTRFPELTTSGQTQNNLRVSTGIVFHF
jgi:opacity protein-like surface antigen